MNWFFDACFHLEAWKIVTLIISLYFFDDDRIEITFPLRCAFILIYISIFSCHFHFLFHFHVKKWGKALHISNTLTIFDNFMSCCYICLFKNVLSGEIKNLHKSINTLNLKQLYYFRCCTILTLSMCFEISPRITLILRELNRLK